jgi:tetratricopeptide (TPR) repeat protein
MRLSIILLICLMLAVPAWAQDEPVPPTDDLEALVERAEAAAQRAETALEEITIVEEKANEAVGLAGDLFGLFEAMSALVGIGVPLGVLLAGVIGFRRLEQANKELREARERFEQEMSEKSRELDHTRTQLEAAITEQSNLAEAQRGRATSASIALSLLLVGERQYRAQDYSGALDTYERAMKLDPLNPITHYRIGYVNTQMSQLEAAKTALERSIELDEDFLPAQAALGYVFRRMGDRIHKEIDRLIEAGVSKDSPDITRLITERDRTYIKSEGNFVESLAQLPKLVDEDGESWWGSLGGLYRRRGQTQQAITAYERCTQVTPQSSYPFSNLALLYAEVGDLEKMQKMYDRVEKLAFGEVQADVDNYWAYADLIVARLAQGKVDATYDVLNTALETAPSDSPFMIESLIDTLRRLQTYLKDDRVDTIDKVISEIKTFVNQREERLEESEEIVAKLAGDDSTANTGE